MTTPQKRPPQQPQFFDSRRMILWSVILVGLVASLGYAAYTTGPSTFGGFDVAMKVTADPTVVPLNGEKAGVVRLNIDLQNRTAAVQRLNAQSHCKLFRWLVIGPSEQLVQAQAAENCKDSAMELVLQPNEKKADVIEIALDAKRLKAGERYQIILEYWGLRGVLIVHAADE
jgi:hypothetical protein